MAHVHDRTLAWPRRNQHGPPAPFAFRLLKQGGGKKSLKTARKIAGWDKAFLAQILNAENC
jgi:hypothetical protein